ncbi:MAG TPA: carbohydrate ABC transporter permease [Aggregatilineales bacterium]|nr:carbohydrate ABC transporter permease [Aggregatilineales bacterium]
MQRMKRPADVRITRYEQMGLGYVIMIVVTVLMAVPVVWMLSTAVRPESTVRQYPIQWIPPDFTLENFQLALNNYPALGHWFLNSAMVATATAALSVLVDTLAAYPLARMQFFAKKFVFIGILATMHIPVEATMVPLYLGLARSGVLQTDFGVYASLILPVVANAFGLYLLTQFFQGIPIELEDAARIDGATDFGIWWRIILPLSGPAITTVIIFSFMASWNNFLWPFIVTSSDLTRTLPAGLVTIFGGITGNPSSVRYGVVMAGSTLATLPPMLVFIALQRFFVQGISMTGIKG